jgi:hypothetical protein
VCGPVERQRHEQPERSDSAQEFVFGRNRKGSEYSRRRPAAPRSLCDPEPFETLPAAHRLTRQRRQEPTAAMAIRAATAAATAGQMGDAVSGVDAGTSHSFFGAKCTRLMRARRAVL